MFQNIDGSRLRDLFKRPKAPAIPGAPTAADLYHGPTAFGSYRPEAANAQGDVQGMAAARKALTNLGGLAQTGWTDTGKQQYESMLRRGQQASAGQRGAALQGAQARGLGTGGAGLLAGMVGSQADANAAADAAVGFAAQGENQRMAATQALGNLGAGLDAQAFGQATSRGTAADQFNQWASGQASNAQQQAFTNQMAIYDARRGAYDANQQRRMDIARMSTLGLTSLFGD